MQRKKIDFNSGSFWLFLFLVGIFLLFPALIIALFIIGFIAYFVWNQVNEKTYNGANG